MSTWAIERRTFSLAEEDQLVAALRSRGIDVIEFTGPAFASNPEIVQAAVPRGSCYFVRHASHWPAWKSSLWGQPSWYDCDHYYPLFARYLLNRASRRMSLNEFFWTAPALANEWSTESLFVRPNDGFKSFAGSVVRCEELDVFRRTLKLQQVEFHAPVYVARPFALHAEWRVQMIAGRAVAVSQYRPHWEAGAPNDVLRFAEEVQRDVSWPAQAYALDIAQTDAGLAVIEIGCLLCTGFYASEPDRVVEALQPIIERAE